ncbi:hypothetical protein BGZ94_009300 [Podila epigama]|nr:hypothetical protein BGZ94_009300 [Podila epigama]
MDSSDPKTVLDARTLYARQVLILPSSRVSQTPCRFQCRLYLMTGAGAHSKINHLNDEVLKTEFGFRIYGVRCKMLKRIKLLKGGIIAQSDQGTRSTFHPSPSISSTGSPAISGRLAGLNIGDSSFSSPFTSESPLLGEHGHDGHEYTRLDEQEPLQMLKRPIRLAGTTLSEGPTMQKHVDSKLHRQPFDNTHDHRVHDHADDGISLHLDSGRSSDNEISSDSDSGASTSSMEIPLSLLRLRTKKLLQREPSFPPSHPLSTAVEPQQHIATGTDISSAPSSSAPISTIKKRIAPTLVSSTLTTLSDTMSMSSIHSKGSPVESPQANITSIPRTGSSNSRKASSGNNHGIDILSRSSKSLGDTHYLPHMGHALADIFYGNGGALLSDESDPEDWYWRPALTEQRSTCPGYKRVVQQNLKRIFRNPPILDLPGHIVYNPVKHVQQNVPVTVVSKSEKSPRVTSSTWNKMFPTTPSILRVELTSDEMTSFNFKAATKGSNNAQTSMTQPEDDFVYPAYGDSDASAYSTDEELYREVAKEENETQKNTSRNTQPRRQPLGAGDVEQLVTQYIAERTERWNKIERPKMQWSRAEILKRLHTLGNIRQQILQLSTKRLPQLRQAMLETSYYTRDDVLRACKALDLSVDLLCSKKWAVELLNGRGTVPEWEMEHEEDTQTSSLPTLKQAALRKQPRSRDSSEEAEEQRQREMDKAFIEDDTSSMDLSFGQSPSRERSPSPDGDPYVTMDGIGSQEILSESESDSDGKTQTVGRTNDKDGTRLVLKEVAVVVQPRERDKDTRVEVTHSTEKKRRKRQMARRTNQAERSAKKLKEFSNADVIVIDDGDDDGDVSMTSPSEDATVPASNADRVMPKEEPAEDPLSRPVLSDVKPRDWSARPRSVSPSHSTSPSPPKPNPPLSSSPREESPRPSKRERKSRRDAARDKDDNSLATFKSKVEDKEGRRRRNELSHPNWMDILDSDNVARHLRGYRRYLGVSVPKDVQSPLHSAYQEYVEWIELDVSSNVSVSEFIAWKRAGHSTKEYRRQAMAALKALQEQEEKEQREQREQEQREQREKETEPVEEMRREKMRPGKEHQDSNDGDSQQSSTPMTLTGSISTSGEQGEAQGIVDDSEEDEVLLEGVSDIRVKRKRRIRAAKKEADEVLRLRKDAVKNERELQKRIRDQERRSMIQTSMDALEEDDILINLGHKKTEKAVAIPKFLAEKLKPHQIDGIRFMWKNVVMFDKGCILAHSMGLGKTFQVISFIYILLREIQAGNKDIPKRLQDGRVLLLLPPIVLDNWHSEFKKWIPPQHLDVVNVQRLPPGSKTVGERLIYLKDWFSEGGVLLLSYDMFRILCTPPTAAAADYSEEDIKRVHSLLLDPGASITIADEGHTIKNVAARISVVASKIKTTSRIILTGYPLQNRLEEYWCMVDFVRPDYLGDINTFKHNYIYPISVGLYPDSTSGEKKVAAKKLKVLTELIKHFVMRKDQSVLRATLPKKIEFVISCKLSQMQYMLYTNYLQVIDSGPFRILASHQVLTVLCNHPAVLKSALPVEKEKLRSQVMSAQEPIPGNPALSSTGSVGMNSAPQSSLAFTGNNATSAISLDSDDEQDTQEVSQALSQNAEVIKDDWNAIMGKKNVTDISNSYKMKLMVDIVVASKNVNEKVLVFSRSIPTLDYAEFILKERGLRFLRMDGATPVMLRQGMINHFNEKEYDLFLISSGSGSQGINLVSASRVIILDVGWNPSIDEQAVARAFRYGQTRKVYVYRLQTYGTFESKVYRGNLAKLSLANRVVDKKNMVKNFTKQELKKYLEPPPKVNPMWATPDNEEALFRQPDLNDPVLRAVVEQDCITGITPLHELIKEEDSDLTEADLLDIDKMINEEKVRIHTKSGQAPSQPIGTTPLQQSATTQPLEGTFLSNPVILSDALAHLVPTTATADTIRQGQSQPRLSIPNLQESGTQSSLTASNDSTPAQGSDMSLPIDLDPISPPLVGSMLDLPEIPPIIESYPFPNVNSQTPAPAAPTEVVSTSSSGHGTSSGSSNGLLLDPIEQERRAAQSQLRALMKDFTKSHFL